MCTISKPLSSFLSQKTPQNLPEKSLNLSEELQRKISLVWPQIDPQDEPELFRFTHEAIQKNSSNHLWTLADKIDALGLFARIDSATRDYILSLSCRLTARMESGWDPQNRLKLFYLLSKPSTAELEDLINFTIWLCRGQEFSAQNQLAMINILLSIPAPQRKTFADQAGELFCGSNALDTEKCLSRCEEFAKLAIGQRNSTYKENLLAKEPS